MLSKQVPVLEREDHLEDAIWQRFPAFSHESGVGAPHRVDGGTQLALTVQRVGDRGLDEWRRSGLARGPAELCHSVLEQLRGEQGLNQWNGALG